jgi:hypothetical protein
MCWQTWTRQSLDSQTLWYWLPPRGTPGAQLTLLRFRCADAEVTNHQGVLNSPIIITRPSYSTGLE